MSNAASLLKEHALKATAPRVAVVEALASMRKPASVQDVLAVLKRGSADQATVYRSLEAFADAGLVRRVDLGKGPSCYELVHEGEHHHHLVCTSCGKIEDVENCGVDAFATRALKASKSFARIDSHSFELFGLCKACA